VLPMSCLALTARWRSSCAAMHSIWLERSRKSECVTSHRVKWGVMFVLGGEIGGGFGCWLYLAGEKQKEWVGSGGCWGEGEGEGEL